MTDLEQAVYDWGRLGFEDWEKALEALGEQGFVEFVAKMMDIHLYLYG